MRRDKDRKTQKVRAHGRLKAKFDALFGKYSWYRPFADDFGFRTLILCAGGALMNIVFVCFNGATAVKYKSVWFGAFAGYYFTLAMQRISILLLYRRIAKKYANDKAAMYRAKLKVYLANGTIFVALDVALGVFAGMLVRYGKPTAKGEIMAIASAAYAFLKIALAVRNLVKAARKDDPITQTIRNISFVDALVSMLVLETTLIGTFGQVTRFMRGVISVSGIAVCLFIVGLGVFMTVRAAKRLKSLEMNSTTEGNHG